MSGLSLPPTLVARRHRWIDICQCRYSTSSLTHSLTHSLTSGSIAFFCFADCSSSPTCLSCLWPVLVARVCTEQDVRSDASHTFHLRHECIWHRVCWIYISYYCTLYFALLVTSASFHFLWDVDTERARASFSFILFSYVLCCSFHSRCSARPCVFSLSLLRAVRFATRLFVHSFETTTDDHTLLPLTYYNGCSLPFVWISFILLRSGADGLMVHQKENLWLEISTRPTLNWCRNGQYLGTDLLLSVDERYCNRILVQEAASDHSTGWAQRPIHRQPIIIILFMIRLDSDHLFIFRFFFSVKCLCEAERLCCFSARKHLLSSSIVILSTSSSVVLLFAFIWCARTNNKEKDVIRNKSGIFVDLPFVFWHEMAAAVAVAAGP